MTPTALLAFAMVCSVMAALNIPIKRGVAPWASVGLAFSSAWLLLAWWVA